MENHQPILLTHLYCVKKIEKWWKKHTSVKELKIVYNYLSSALNHHDLQDLSNKCHSITKTCKGDGAGLSGGTLVDMLLCNYFQDKLEEYIEYHEGESDMKICDIPLSQKKINGKSTIALDWSKNEKKGQREHFSCGIIIINLKSEKWWKKNPIQSVSNIKITYNDEIPSGIYLIDKQFCKYYIKLTSNNKTDTLIESQYLYIMLKRSISQQLFIGLPSPNKELKFNILNAFL
jgi:hypothetical protein